MPSCPSVFVDGRYQFKQYVPTKGTTSFVCGICVGHGLFEEEMRAKRAQEGASKMKRAKKKIAEGKTEIDWRNLKKVRREILRVTQAKLAEILGTKQANVSLVEKGERRMPDSWPGIPRPQFDPKYID